MSNHSDPINDWVEVPLAGSSFAVQEDEVVLALFWGEFDTPSDYFTNLVMHPLETLLEDQRFTRYGLNAGWRVRTTIFNHHKGLNPRIGFATAEVSSEDEEVYLTIYKHNPA